MKIDITSMFFNSKIEGKTATAAWGTAFGQSEKSGYRFDLNKSGVTDIIIGMSYRSKPDVENLNISKGSKDRDLIMFSVFDKIFINGQMLDNVQYTFIIVREHSASHNGRLLWSYAPYISYNGIDNSVAISKMQESLNCNVDGCWFVYDISIKNQDEVYFSAVVVDPEAPKVYYSDSTSRSKEWKLLANKHEQTNEADFRRKEFGLYLKECTTTNRRSGINFKYGESAITSIMAYTNPDVLFEGLDELKESIGDICSISSTEDMDNVCEQLLSDETFISLDNKRGQWGSRTITLYNCFLHARELFSTGQEVVSKFQEGIREKTSQGSIGNIIASSIIPRDFVQFITAIKTKPFVLLAGISGTGKSRIVRQLARACDTIDANPWEVQKPQNFEMIQVRPDWHDGSELLGYESRISGKPEYVVKNFVKFIVKAWIYEDENVPFFLCLDEMNLAPVEQYFAEYLSVVESRRLDESGRIVCDPLIRLNKEYCESIANEIYGASESDDNDVLHLNEVDELMSILESLDYCIPLPKNLIVMGTVNMDETTFSFSRKVLDRAMTIEMNEVDLMGGLTDVEKERFRIAPEQILPNAVEGKDVYAGNEELCNKVIKYLQEVNDVLEGSPFKIAYRTRNEFLIYAVNRGAEHFIEAMDEMTNMKILSRIEGDQEKLKDLLDRLDEVLKQAGLDEKGQSRKKIAEMNGHLESGYTSYWS